MLKFVTRRIGKRDVVGLGLERRNIERMIEGNPVVVSGESIGLDHDIFIFFGETLETMIADLEKAGIELPPKEQWKRDGRV